ncbi:hypothetical protein SERN_0089 [Serinibacter arcticus]|uniref:DUF3046 domain-containing protein n=1 Tax=Serinibacter arcticus TaxID=1655435 RepID=A0A4Z1E8J6_9MICO|nr:hypothetical protein SERN_0089 [Serinibacter arcticus]
MMSGLDGRTADEALAAGVPPREVWEAVCDATGQDDTARWLHREDLRKVRRPRRG